MDAGRPTPRSSSTLRSSEAQPPQTRPPLELGGYGSSRLIAMPQKTRTTQGTQETRHATDARDASQWVSNPQRIYRSPTILTPLKRKGRGRTQHTSASVGA